jgi:hypothetical protein
MEDHLDGGKIIAEGDVMSKIKIQSQRKKLIKL